ncbi:HK97 family phage prohead protease [Agromyces archimandritae]|uniref:HK97 family phage prohead protease n=1 Tax=Agromyces archimandritae TaxID=2781962 RepID=A0A975IPK9_9MICO|nr:HK97 family phage prohead protease [Agromyces archimandritae]QTX04116.1 HK97 family phage prohead protease [Agromyces archimandritae]
MTDYARLLAEHATRELAIRSTDTDRREITGIAVPWGQRADIGGWFTEEFERGSIQDSDGALYFYGHREPIGRIIAYRDTDEGWEITAVVSNTRAGDDALTLARDGVLTRHSVGFRFDQYQVDESGDIPHITHTRAKVHEVSLVPFPAYDGAVVTDVRHAHQPTTKETPMDPEETVRELATELEHTRNAVDELERRFTMDSAPAAPAPDTRSAGEVLRAIVAGDETTIAAYNQLMERAYTGGTTADAPIQDAWIGDLTRLFDASSGVLAAAFSTGSLPAQGMTMEWGELASNTVTVDKQAAEGDDLAYGKVTLTTRTSPVSTYGGYTQLSRQAIERSTLPLLNRSLEALAIAAGARKKAVLRAAFNTLVASRVALADDAGVVGLGATLAAAEAGHWEDALVDAALKYDTENAAPESLIVSPHVFKALRALTVDGERVFTVAEKNASGTLNLPGLTGNLAGLPVRLDPGQSTPSAVFVNARAIRQYDSALVSLQDENIINLSKDFSVYRYGAIAPEVPQLVVPVKIQAA